MSNCSYIHINAAKGAALKKDVAKTVELLAQTYEGLFGNNVSDQASGYEGFLSDKNNVRDAFKGVGGRLSKIGSAGASVDAVSGGKLSTDSTQKQLDALNTTLQHTIELMGRLGANVSNIKFPQPR